MFKWITFLILISYTQELFPAENFNVLILGWDGCRRRRLSELREGGKLPNFERLIKNGSFANTMITKDATETKPGWSQILSGYSSQLTNVVDNSRYAPIPKGKTIFEVFKAQSNDKIKTFFITGKINNTGARGPHDICTNCKTRFEEDGKKTEWWVANPKAPLMFGKKQIIEKRAGEPFYNALAKIDFYKSGVPTSEEVYKLAFQKLDEYKSQQFLGFIHLEEPDETGHVLGEFDPRYKGEIKKDDKLLGELLNYLDKNNLLKKTKILLVTDHGFKPFTRGHYEESEQTWLATNFPIAKTKGGDRLDITPTVYDIMKIDPKFINPPTEGKSLLK